MAKYAPLLLVSPGRNGERDGRSIWSIRAEGLLEQALDEVRDGTDAIVTVDMALACLRIEDGSLPADEMDGYTFPGEEVCICPVDLLERGGFRGGCPVHSLAAAGIPAGGPQQ